MQFIMRWVISFLLKESVHEMVEVLPYWNPNSGFWDLAMLSNIKTRHIVFIWMWWCIQMHRIISMTCYSINNAGQHWLQFSGRTQKICPVFWPACTNDIFVRKICVIILKNTHFHLIIHLNNWPSMFFSDNISSH